MECEGKDTSLPCPSGKGELKDMGEIRKLFGVNNLEIDAEEKKLYIEEEKNDGVVIDLNQNEVMHLLARFIEADIDVGKDIYGIDMDDLV